MKQILSWALEALSLTGIANALVYLVIALLFIIGIIRCVVPVSANKSILKRAIRALRSDGGRRSSAWKEEGFLGRKLQPHWSSFLRNFNFADIDAHNNASKVEDYINEDTLFYGPGHTAFSDALPGLFVSLGFLGTLIGLAQGLAGFNTTNSEAVQLSIRTLIPGMRYAFTTSIVGVVASLAFTLINRAVFGSAEKTLQGFYVVMYRQPGVKSVEPMNQIAAYQHEQTALIEEMTEELPRQMSEAIREAIAPLDNTMREFMSVNTKDQLRFMDTIVMRFTERMDQAMGSQLANFARVLEDTSKAQQQSVQLVRSGMTEATQSIATLKEVRGVATDLLDRSANYMELLRRNQSQGDEAYRKMGDCIDQMDVIVRQQAAYLKSIADMQSYVVENMKAMTSAIGEFKRIRLDSAAAAEAMEKASENLSASGEMLQNAHMQTSIGIKKELETTMDAYREYVNQFTQRVDYLANSIAGALKKMPGAVEDTNTRFLDQMHQLTRTLEEAQRSLDEAVDRLYRR